MKLIEFIRKVKPLKTFVNYLHVVRAKGVILPQIEPLIGKDEKVLDIGAGTCHVYSMLTEKGYQVTPLDVWNNSFFSNISPVIYNGAAIPYADNHFDASMVLTVLHHTRKQEEIIREAARVSRRVIIMEDVYHNALHKYATYAADCFGNFEFIGHPHTNRTDREWRKLFGELGLKLKEARYRFSCYVFQHALYILEK